MVYPWCAKNSLAVHEFNAKVVNKSQLLWVECVLKAFWSSELRGQDYLAMPAMDGRGWLVGCLLSLV